MHQVRIRRFIPALSLFIIIMAVLFGNCTAFKFTGDSNFNSRNRVVDGDPNGPYNPSTAESVGSMGAFNERTIPGTRIDAKQEGAMADGVADDTVALQAAIDKAIQTASYLFLPPSPRPYRISKALILNGPVKIIGGYPQPTITQIMSGTPGLGIQGSSIEISNVKLTGTGSTHEYKLNANAIELRGKLNQKVTNISIHHMTIEDWDFNGIYAEFAEQILVHHNLIQRISYSGMSYLSCKGGQIHRNVVSDIKGQTRENQNGYGITLTKALGPESTFPNTTEFTVEENHIFNVLTWEGLDTHGGQQIVFRKNLIENCRYGIVLTTARDETGYIYAAKDITITENTIRRIGDVAIPGVGIQAGATSATHPQENIFITNNEITGYGKYGDISTADAGAIVVYIGRNVNIESNVIIGSANVGLFIYTHLINFRVARNRFSGTRVPENDSPAPAAISISGEQNTGLIEENNFTVESGYNRFGYGIRAAAGNGNNIQILNNIYGTVNQHDDPSGVLH